MDKNKINIKNKNVFDDDKIDSLLRPQKFDDFIGQDDIKKNLKIFINSAKKRFEHLDHCLLHSPPGLGKTTLANIIAKEVGTNFKSTSGPVLEKIGDLAAILTNLSKNDVFFIDEIHRINHLVEESLYSVMEDFNLDVIVGQGPSAKTLKLSIPHFTLIGATTRMGLLSIPLRDRFGIIEHLNFYKMEELIRIINRSAIVMNINITDSATEEIAKRSRGTPRILNRLLKRVRDFSNFNDNNITYSIAIDAFNALDIDNIGLDKIDRLILTVLIKNFNGGPVGINTIAGIISENIDTITDVYEPYLIQLGLITRTPKGRIVTERAYKHMGFNYKNSKNLFKI
jgi:Holliday junction DNA helicase RuvB